MQTHLEISAILDCIAQSDELGLQTDRRDQGLDGISGDKTVGLLQRLVSLFESQADTCYLEVGVFQGLTLISTALEAPRLPCFGVDNFATLDPERKNLSIVEHRMDKFSTTNAQLINQDFEHALERLDDHIGNRKVGVYFVDGPHDYRSQLICLTLIKPFLHANAVIVIDDANYPDVRWSTRDFLLGHNDFRLAFDAYSPGHPANLTTDVKVEHERGWLNGVNVLVRDPAHSLEDMLPPTAEHERQIYLNEWLAHRLRLAELAPEALALADTVVSGDTEAETVARQDIIAGYKSDKQRYDDRFSDRNMYSEHLPMARRNRPRA